MVSLLLSRGANINAFDKKDRRAIHWAAYMGMYIFQLITIVVVKKKFSLCLVVLYISRKNIYIVSSEVICVSARKPLIVYFKLPCKCAFVVRKINLLEKVR